jgi:hypothetical protein
MDAIAFEHRHARLILEQLIMEKRTWVNQVTEWEQVCLKRAGYMKLERRNKRLVGAHTLYLWTEAGRQALIDVRKTLLEGVA